MDIETGLTSVNQQKNMLEPILIDLFKRELKKLEEEILAYTNEEDLWKTTQNIANSAGNLCLHLCGNLQHFIGATLGHSGYIRNREEEFSKKYIPRDEIMREIRQTSAIVDSTLSTLTEKDLDVIYPLHVLGRELTVSHFLVHLYGHLNYHLGQINYHRRLVQRVDSAF